MSSKDKRSDPLPVTAEVGGEGGSFADPTTQVSTFEGDIGRTGDAAGDTADVDVIESDTASGIRKYPTEP